MYLVEDFDFCKFTAKKRDNETGLDYFGARYYSAPLGRFISPDPLMASAKASNPQSWNRYTYTFNNPLRFIDPDGLEVDEECVEDPKCKIKVKVNVIYDETAFDGTGIDEKRSEKDKKQFEKTKKNFENSNIYLEEKYTEGGFDRVANKPTGYDADALNIYVSSKDSTGKKGYTGQVKGTDIPMIVVSIDDANNSTRDHEIGHNFLGHAGNSGKYLFQEISVNSRILFQSLGFSQQAFREGLAPRRYAVPLDSEANKPRKE